MTDQTVLVRYREKGGALTYEYITGTNAEIEATLNEYLSSKDPHSLLVLGSTSSDTQVQLVEGDDIIGRVKITDGTRIAELDTIDGAQIGIDLAHHEVHEGNSFTTSDIDANVQVAAPKYWLIRIPDNVEFHTKISVESDTGALLEFFENPTINADGVVVPFYNNNRNSSKTTTMVCYRNPTAGADGTRLQVSRVGAGRDKKLGGVGRTQFEWILKSGEEYIIKITVDANGAEVTFTMDGYQP